MYEITAVRTVPSDDLSHDHVELAGYVSQHMPGEPIMVDVARIIERIAFGDGFTVTVDGQPSEVTAGKCEICGHEPHLRSAADGGGPSRLLDLPRR